MQTNAFLPRKMMLVTTAAAPLPCGPHYPIFVHLERVPACDRRTDGIVVANTALCIAICKQCDLAVKTSNVLNA